MSGDTKAARVGDLIANCPDSHSEIASKVGVDKSLVTRWRSGARVPSPTQLAKLEQLYGRPAPPPRAKRKPKAASAPAPAPPPPLPPRSRDAGGPLDSYAEENNTDRLRRYIRDGMSELEHDTELSGVKRAEALKKLVDAQVALDRSTGENALTMGKIAAHPEFRRVVRLITEALAPHPDVLAKVLDVLKANP
jgi:transcriptional regulator with XRE-family HTH domain